MEVSSSNPFDESPLAGPQSNEESTLTCNYDYDELLILKVT